MAFREISSMLQMVTIESIYSVILMAICMTIYNRTREYEKLSFHKGIKYFRKTFLFFAISYFFKFVTRLLLLGLGPKPGHMFFSILPALPRYQIKFECIRSMPTLQTADHGLPDGNQRRAVCIHTVSALIQPDAIRAD